MIALDKLGKSNSQREGVWCEYEAESAEGPATRFKIAAHGNSGYTTKFDKLRKKVARRGDLDELPLAKQVDVVWRAMFETVVMDWEGILSDGKPVPFTEANFMTLFTSDDMTVESIRRFVLTESKTEANFIAERNAADAAAVKSGAGVAA